MSGSMLYAALGYAGRGGPVLPLRGKRALTPHGSKDGSTEPVSPTSIVELESRT